MISIHAARFATLSAVLSIGSALPLAAQLTDVNQAPNAVNAGIQKSLTDQVGAGRGDALTPGSSRYIIARDPFRAIRRGRQLFQRKFTVGQGLGPRTGDGFGDIGVDRSVGAGISDSCAGCHGRPFGSAGFGGNVSTRPLSRDAPHLFGLGLKEMLADEISLELRSQRDQASALAQQIQAEVKVFLTSKGISYGSIRALPDGSFDTTDVDGIDASLRVRPFFHHGETISMREFIVGAFNAEMGLESPDPDLVDATANGLDVTTPSGMQLLFDDAIEAPPVATSTDDSDSDGVQNEIDPALIDFMEFYLLNYFKPAVGRVTPQTLRGRQSFIEIGCVACHVPDLLIDRDRRVADVDTSWNGTLSNGVFNELYATAVTLHDLVDDGQGFPPLKPALGDPFLVQNIFTDFKRHDLGKGFAEIEFDGSVTNEHITTPLWGVGSTPPYGHDGRSADLRAVILRHGGEALASREAFENDLEFFEQLQLIAFLNSLVLFSPEDTASNLNQANLNHPDFPAQGQGSIALVPLFNDQNDPE